MMILIVDGQGGGIGKGLILALREALRGSAELVAVGTNSAATAAMLRAGADAAVTGENPVIYNSARADVILGPLGILLPNAMLGEITPAMAAAIAGSSAQKVLIPFSKCSVSIAGLSDCSMDTYIRQAAELVVKIKNSGAGRE